MTSQHLVVPISDLAKLKRSRSLWELSLRIIHRRWIIGTMKSIGYMVKNRTFVTNFCTNRLAVQKVTNVWSVKSRHSRTPGEACDDNRLFCVISKTNQHASECQRFAMWSTSVRRTVWWVIYALLHVTDSCGSISVDLWMVALMLSCWLNVDRKIACLSSLLSY